MKKNPAKALTLCPSWHVLLDVLDDLHRNLSDIELALLGPTEAQGTSWKLIPPWFLLVSVTSRLAGVKRLSAREGSTV